MPVTLEELYNGAVRKLSLQKSIICEKCEGRGGKKGAVEKCNVCRGLGMESKIQQIAPGIVQQFDQICRSCAGQGEIIAAKDRCKNCGGKKLVRDRKILEVHIEKGMKDGQRITFTGEGDQEPNLEPGDIVVVLDEKQHPNWLRVKNDLIMKMPLELVEALCGFKKVITTLDDRQLVIQTCPGEVIKHESTKCIMNEGMPHFKQYFEKGCLIIQFFVVFPESIPAEIIPTLEQCLPPKPFVNVPESAEECALVSFIEFFFRLLD